MEMQMKLLPPPPDKGEAYRLRNLMSQWSENKWCAGWMSSIETELWHEDGLNDPDVYEIHYLAQQLGIWWESYVSHVPLEKWIEMHGEPYWWKETHDE